MALRAANSSAIASVNHSAVNTCEIRQMIEIIILKIRIIFQILFNIYFVVVKHVLVPLVFNICSFNNNSEVKCSGIKCLK